jgi:hypothetical protein
MSKDKIQKSIYQKVETLRKLDKIKKHYERETKTEYKFNDVVTRLIEDKFLEINKVKSQ